MKTIRYEDLSPDERAQLDALRRKALASAEIVKMLDRHGLVDALLNGERVTLVLPGGVLADIRGRRGSVPLVGCHALGSRRRRLRSTQAKRPAVHHEPSAPSGKAPLVTAEFVRGCRSAPPLRINLTPGAS